MIKDYSMYIEDMLESIKYIDEYIHAVSEVQFSQDKQLQDAVIRRLGVIGEAATKLSKEIKEKIPEIPWKSVVGLRNIIIHEYAHVSMGKVWDVLQNDIPPLKNNLQRLLKLIS